MVGMVCPPCPVVVFQVENEPTHCSADFYNTELRFPVLVVDKTIVTGRLSGPEMVSKGFVSTRGMWFYVRIHEGVRHGQVPCRRSVFDVGETVDFP
jgi:hypothetical protein